MSMSARNSEVQLSHAAPPTRVLGDDSARRLTLRLRLLLCALGCAWGNHRLTFPISSTPLWRSRCLGLATLFWSMLPGILPVGYSAFECHSTLLSRLAIPLLVSVICIRFTDDIDRLLAARRPLFFFLLCLLKNWVKDPEGQGTRSHSHLRTARPSM